MGNRLLNGFVVLQVTVALVLLLGAGLLLRSFVRLQRIDAGFDRENILTLSIPLLEDRYSEPLAGHQLYDQLTERVAALPAVENAAGVLIRPLQGPLGYDYPFTIEGRGAEEQATYPFLNYEAVTPTYFETLGIPLMEGRGFSPADREQAPGVVILSSAAARRFWPGRSPVGKRIKWGGPESEAPWLEVVGVAADARYRRFESQTLDVYVPHRQSPWSLNHLAVRTHRDPLAVAAAVREEIRRIDPALQTLDVATTGQLISNALARPRFNTALISIYGLLALVLGAVGIYGVLSYTVALRTRELGIRLALGATPRQVAAETVAGSVRWTLAGLVLGVLLALALTRWLESVLYEVSATDPTTFVAVPLMLLAVAVIAGLVPAWRAGGVDPVEALRAE